MPLPFHMSLAIEAKPTREGQKTRVFHAGLLALVVAPGLGLELSATRKDNTLRPVLLTYAATELETRAFTANLRAGLPAVHTRTGRSFRIEIPRSAGFRYETVPAARGTLTHAYRPSAFALQPQTADASALRFLCMPPRWWVEREAATLTEFGSDAREAALAAYFVAYLDRRTPLPIANNLRFHLALYRAALSSGWCHEAKGSPDRTPLYAEGCDTLGFESPLLVSTTYDDFSAFLAEQTARHLPRLHEESHVQTHI
jgi:hypothetical protein